MIVWFESLGDRFVNLVSRPGIFALIVALLCGTMSMAFRVPDPDLFARVAVGNLVQAHGGIPYQDPFAFTPLKPRWFDHEWLSGVIFFHLVMWGGEWSLVLVKIAACALTAALTAGAGRLAAERARPPFGWWLCSFYLTVSVWLSTVRSHIFTYLFLALLILIFEGYRRRKCKAPLWLVPVIFAIWVNCHGGFVTGLGYLGVMTLGMWVSDRQRAPVPSIVLGLSVAACFVNPYGASYLIFVWEAVSMDRPYVTEWYPPSITEGAYYPFFLVLGLLCAAALRGYRMVPVGGLIMLALAAFFGLQHARLVPLFGLFALVYGWPMVEVLVARSSERVRDLGRASERLVASLLVIVGVPLTVLAVARPIERTTEFFDYALYPRQALDWLWATGESGRLLIDFDRGSFAIWRLYPRFQISLDGRYEELYPNSTIELVVAALDPGHPDHAAAFQVVAPTEVLVDRGHRGYEEPQLFGAGWAVRYRDERFAIVSSRPLFASPVPSFAMWEPRYGSSSEELRR